MSVVVSMQEVGPCRQQLKIEIPAAAVEQERKQVLKEYERVVKIPGFRKGKVPPGLIRQRFGSDMDKDVVERLLPRFWRQAEEESRIKPLLAPEVQEVGDVVAGESLSFTATVETRPAVELTDLDGFDLPDPSVEPTEEEIQEAVDELRRQVAPWAAVDRAAARGDRVQAQLVEIPDPAAVSSGEAGEPEPQSIEIEVGDPRVWEELSLAVTGLSAGQEARFSHRNQPPVREGESQPDMGGGVPERHFRVTISAVEERELPPLDDEFAKSVGEFDTVEELKDRAREHLAAGKQETRRNQRREALLEQLRQRYPLQLPRGVVDEQVRELLNEQAGRLARQGVDLERAGIDWQRVSDEARPHAERLVHNRLLLEAVAEKESIELEPQELEATLAALARAQGTSVPVLRRNLGEERLEELRAQLIRSEVIRRLLGDDVETDAAATPAAP